jgi:predicted O-methyltransferase YrrM
MNKEQILKIDYSEVLKQDIGYFEKELNLDWVYRKGEASQLLNYISNQFNNVTILDAGTHYGWSAYALKQNPTNKIITYDITDKFENKYLNDVTNIEVKILDINQESVDIIHSAEAIYLDIDPHDGIQEKVFTDMLHRIEWQGYLFCDDIHINGGMENWWNSILLDKYNLTEIGHLHGTGLITFNRKVSIIK